MRDPRRTFTLAQRRDIWAAAVADAGGGQPRCSRCGVELLWSRDGRRLAWHADHVTPWSRGDATHVATSSIRYMSPGTRTASSDRKHHPRYDARMAGAVRGYESRKTDLMEQLQLSHFRAIAAASGCIVSQPEIDDGIDLMVTHQAEAHTAQPDQTARLEVQLKATHRYASTGNSSSYSVSMRRDRWDYFRTPSPTVPKIIVIMNVPEPQELWTAADHDAMLIHHAAYWVNIAGTPDSSAARPTVRAPRVQMLSDISLCEIMVRIGQGLAP